LRATIRITGLAIAGFTLAACATTMPPPVVAVAPAPKAPEAEGIFKIGTPYQVDGKWYYPAEDYAYVQEGIASAAHPTLPLPSVVHVTNLDNGRQLSVRVNDRGPFHSSRIIDVSRRAAQLLGFYDVGTARVRVEIDATESLNLKNLALKEHPPEMPKVVAAPREAISSVALAPVTAMSNEVLPPAPGTPAANTTKGVAAKAVPPKTAAKPPTKLPEGPPARVARADPGQSIPGYYIQAGAFSDPGNAQRLEEQLRTLGSVVIEPVTVNNSQVYRVRVGPFANAAAAEALLDRVKGFSRDDAKVVRE
jgi:rare lipoprotein A